MVDNHNHNHSHSDNFIDGEDYIFENSEENSKVTLNFKGYSRIDGHPIFEIINDTPLTSPLSKYTYDNRSIINISIITNLGDHILKYRNIKHNKELLLDYFMKLYDISDDDLLHEESTKIIIREMRLNQLLK